MKNYLISFSVIITLLFFLQSCGGEASTVDNQYLGKLPSLEKDYYNQMEEKEKEIKECTDMEEAFTLTKEKKLLKEELQNSIEEYISANPISNSLPFQALSETQYTIKDVVVNKASAGNLNLKFLVTINEDMKNKYGGMEKTLFIYFKAQDSKGNDIPKTITVATNFKTQELKAGLEYEAFGTWQNKSTRNLEDFAKIIEIDRAEYDKK
jgi:hypothetical protein